MSHQFASTQSTVGMGFLDAFYARRRDMDEVVSPSVGVNASMVKDTKMTLLVTESMFSFSGDDFSVKDANTSETVIKVKGQMFSFHDRKKIVDTDDNLLFNISDKMIANEKTFVGKNKEGDVLKVWRPRGWSLGSKLSANFKNFDGCWAELELSGDFWGGSANISANGVDLAHISRDMVNTNEVVADQQTYELTVAPGVDVSLMVALCICFDELKNEAENEAKEE